MEGNKKYICIYCKVEVRGPDNTRAILGLYHLPNCPRHTRDGRDGRRAVNVRQTR